MAAPVIPAVRALAEEGGLPPILLGHKVGWATTPTPSVHAEIRRRIVVMVTCHSSFVVEHTATSPNSSPPQQSPRGFRLAGSSAEVFEVLTLFYPPERLWSAGHVVVHGESTMGVLHSHRVPPVHNCVFYCPAGRLERNTLPHYGDCLLYTSPSPRD